MVRSWLPVQQQQLVFAGLQPQRLQHPFLAPPLLPKAQLLPVQQPQYLLLSQSAPTGKF
jgi:hypothetical protein